MTKPLIECRCNVVLPTMIYNNMISKFLKVPEKKKVPRKKNHELDRGDGRLGRSDGEGNGRPSSREPRRGNERKTGGCDKQQIEEKARRITSTL